MNEAHKILGLTPGSGAAHSLWRIATSLGKIEAVAMIRWKTGYGLIESKNLCERFLAEEQSALTTLPKKV